MLSRTRSSRYAHVVDGSSARSRRRQTFSPLQSSSCVRMVGSFGLIARRGGPLKRQSSVFDLTDSLTMFPLAAAHAPKIETQHHRTATPQTAGDAVNHFVVHGSTEQRMRMADYAGFDGLTVFRRFEQRFQFSRGPIEQVRLDAAGH